MKIAAPIWVGLSSLAAGAGLVAATAYGVHGRSSQVFGRSVYRGTGRRKSVALTFDDGPSLGTPRVLEYLAQQDVKATFFQCGVNVLRHPEIAREVRAAGHEIGNHTFSHARLCPRLSRSPNFKSPSSIYSELARAQEVIGQALGEVPTLFRAPYGLRWMGVGAAQRRLNLLGVMWTVIGRDWELPAIEIASVVLSKADPGGIICLHDGRDIRPEADIDEMLRSLRSIIPTLKERGFRFERVSDLLLPDLD